MKKCIVFIISVLMFGIFISDKAQAKTEKNINAFEFYFRDEGENTCRITEIRIKKDKGISELKIPDTINGKTVVSIGEGVRTNKWNEDVETNAFVMYVPVDCDTWDWISESEAQKRRAKKIKKIILPDTIKEIRDYAFAGLKGLKTIQLSKNLVTIGECAFGATSIKKMHLPEGLTAIGEQLFFKSPIKSINIPAKLKDGVVDLARTAVSWKHFTVSKKNPYYKTNKDYLLSKDGKTVYALIKAKKKIRIPDKVKILASFAFYNVSLKSVHLGAGVREIEGCALSTKTRCKITLSSKNPYLARSGMCIYDKKKQNLLVGIPQKSNERIPPKLKKIYILKISSKITTLDENFSIVGIGKKYKVRKVYIPQSVKKMPTGWSLGFLAHKNCTYASY